MDNEQCTIDNGQFIAINVYAANGLNQYTNIINSQLLTINSYVWGLDVSGTLQGAGGVGGLLCANVNFTSHNIYYVNNFNISEYVTSDGTVAAHYEYGAFGNTTAATGPMAADFTFRYSTKYLDFESGFYYYGYRYYDPATGRWLRRDPIEEKGELIRGQT